MPKLKITTARKLTRFLKKHGFVEQRQTGSHLILVKKNHENLVIPLHQGKDLGRGLIFQILKKAQIDLKLYQKEI